MQEKRKGETRRKKSVQMSYFLPVKKIKFKNSCVMFCDNLLEH